MKPLTIITGVIMGSSVAISLGLVVVVVLFLTTGLEEPLVRDEFPALTGSLGQFFVLTAASVSSFVLLIKNHRWRWWGQALMWLALASVVWRYWPSS